MYPLLFEVGSFKVHSYYVLWTLALSVAVVMTRKRMTELYDLGDDDARAVIIMAFVGMLMGARVGGALEFWPKYAAEPARLLRFWEGGLSAVPAFLGAGIGGIVASWRRRVPIWAVADGASIPAAFAVAIGRWGCFMNGCCAGRETTVPWGVVFPGDSLALVRHPTQLYYAFGALFIGALLLRLEGGLSYGADRIVKKAVLWPLFMILYALLRLTVDPFREEFASAGLQGVRATLLFVLASGGIWLLRSTLSWRKSGKLRNLG